MSRYTDILTVHHEWLMSREYLDIIPRAERAVRFTHPDLQATLRKVVNDTFLENQPQSFTFDLRKQFEKDTVEFQFDYSYDPVNVRLKLNYLHVYLHGSLHTYPLPFETRRALPTANDAYKRIKAAHEKKSMSVEVIHWSPESANRQRLRIQ